MHFASAAFQRDQSEDAHQCRWRHPKPT